MSSNDSIRAAFFHANGFPTGVYRRLFEELAGPLEIVAPAIIRPSNHMGQTRRWEGLRDAAQSWLDEHGAGCEVLIGHSMGGYLALMCAAQKPTRFRHVILIDAPLVLGWRSLLLTSVRTLGLARKVGPAAIAARRRDEWPDIHQARAFFASKPFVQAWAPGVLHSFLKEGLRVEANGTVRLVIERELERDIYAYLAHQSAWKSFKTLRRYSMPISMVAGSVSTEMRLAGAAQVKRLFAGRWKEIDAGHLLPFEKPAETAQAITELLQRDQPVRRATQTTAP